MTTPVINFGGEEIFPVIARRNADINLSEVRIDIRQGSKTMNWGLPYEVSGNEATWIVVSEDLVAEGFDVTAPINVMQAVWVDAEGEIVVWHE